MHSDWHNQRGDEAFPDVSADGLLIAARKDFSVDFVNLTSLTVEHALNRQTAAIQPMALSPDNRLPATVSEDRTVRL